MEYLYAALLLHKLKKPINEESLKKVVTATGVEVDDAKIKILVTSLEGVDIDKELEGATLVAASSAGSEETGKETDGKEKEKKKEEKASEAAEGLSALFG